VLNNLEFSNIFKELGLPKEVESVLIGTFNVRYTQELLGFLAINGVVTPDKLKEILSILDDEVQDVDEEKQAQLKLDEAIGHMRSYLLGQILGKFVTNLPDDQQELYKKSIADLMQRVEQVQSITEQPS
jgi:hypothetical protein